MSARRAIACILGVVLGIGVGCSTFGDEPDKPPVPAEGGSTDAAADATSPDAGPVAFCAQHPLAIFCDDFEANDLDARWPTQILQLGVADVLDGTDVGRPGRVLRFLRTKPGADNEFGLYLRANLAPATIPVRVAYDLRTNDYGGLTGASNVTAGGVIHGNLRTWMVLPFDATTLTYLAYAGDFIFSEYFGVGAAQVPRNRWEHYELLIVPGASWHFEAFVGVPPKSVAVRDVPVDAGPGGTLAPTFAEVGLSRSNAGPMPEITAYFDNFVVTAP